jgi:hypothetical protein
MVFFKNIGILLASSMVLSLSAAEKSAAVGGSLQIKNCIVLNDKNFLELSSSVSASYSFIQGTPPSGNSTISSIQALKDVVAPADTVSFYLSPLATIVNAGSNSEAGSIPAKDINGNPRIYDTTIDAGAIEYSLIYEKGINNWNTASHWNIGRISTENDVVTIRSRCKVTTENAICKKIIGISDTAYLSIEPNQFLTVKETIQNTNPSCLIVRASTDGSSPNGSLVFHNAESNPVYGTVEMYSKSHIDQNGATNNKYFWQYFGIPFRSLQADPSFYNAFVRKWDETGSTIFNHWLQLEGSDILQSFLGYEICQPSAKTYTLQGILENRDFSTRELAYTTTALYPGQHIFGNSYTDAIDITKINFGSNMEATVYLYNTGSYYNWETNSGGTSYSSGNTNTGTYAAIPQNQAGQGGIQGQIPSMQGFLVKAMSGSSGNTISIPYSSVAVKNTTLQRAKAAEENDSEKKQYLRIDLKTDTVIVDRMWIFNEENCTRSFDNGWDGPKMLPASGTPALCAIEKDGLYQVNSVNDMDETKLGFRKGTETEYSLTFYPKNLQQRYPAVYLLDEVANQAVKIENETVYSFTATGTENLQQRFRIVTRYYEKGEPEEETQIKVFSSKGHIVIDNLSSENGEALIYDMAGRKVGQEKFFANNITVFGDYPTGAYVVRAVSKKETETKRIVVW